MIEHPISSELIEGFLEDADFPAPELLDRIPVEFQSFYSGTSRNPYLATLFNVIMKAGDDQIVARQFVHVNASDSSVRRKCEATASRMTLHTTNLYKRTSYGTNTNLFKVIHNIVNPASPHAAARHFASEDDQLNVAYLLFAVWVADADRTNLSDLQLVNQYAGIASNPVESTVEWVEHAAALSRFGRAVSKKTYLDSDTRTLMQELNPVSTFALTTIREHLKISLAPIVYEDVLRLVEVSGGWDELADLTLVVPAATLLALA